MRVVAVPRETAEDLRRELHRIGMVDRTVRITKRGGEVLIPLREDPPFDLGPYGARLQSVAELPQRPVARDPQKLLEERLRDEGIPAHVAPSRWERIGDVLVLRLSEEARRHDVALARAFAAALGVRTVVEDRSGIHGVLRTPDVRVLYGTNTETIHLEGGVRYALDVARIMFSSGNMPERTSIASKVRDGAVVVDLFAGIGYFVLPIAVHARPARVYACELNPVAFQYLLQNLRLNRADNVIPLFGDCRETAPRGVADVVLMGYFSASDYLDVAFRALRGSGLVVYHELCPREQFPQVPLQHFTDAARAHWYDVESVASRIRKSYAPGIVHAVLEARVQRRPKGAGLA